MRNADQATEWLAHHVPVPAVTRRSDARLAPRVISSIALSYLGVVVLLPMGALVVEAVGVGAPSILRALGSSTALHALGTSVGLMALCVAVNAIVGTAGAIAIARHRMTGRHLLSALADLPLAVSPVMIGLGLLILVGRDGWLSPLTAGLGVKVAFAFPGLLLASLFVTLPFTVRELVYVLEEIGTSEEEAAATLGASPWQIFVRVTLPNIRSALGYGLLMTAARCLGEFGAVLVLGGSITGHTQTATTFIHDAIEQRDLAGAYGMALVLALISMSLLLALEVIKPKRHEARR